MRNCSNDSLEADAEIDLGQTRMYEPWLDGIDLSLASQRCGFDDPDPKFLEIVKTERLILYGRTGNTERGQIKASDIERVDIQQSTVVAGRIEFADVTAWPVLRSPSRVDLVSNSSLAEVFERYLLKDPEVVALSPSAIAIRPELARVFEDGWYTPHGMREWRVDLEFSFLGGFERGSAFGCLDDTGPPALIDAIDALNDRFAALVGMLRNGEIEAYGLPHRSAYPPVIMRSLWSHKDSLLDLRNGDLYFDNPEADNLRAENQTKLWTAIMLHRGDSAPNLGEFAREKLHKTLGLSKERVYSGLHEAAATADGPVPISVERRQPGIPIPKEAPAAKPAAESRVKIDAARLARARRETEKVSELLASIFEEETAPAPADGPTSSTAKPSAFEGLDRYHSELIEFIELKGSIPKAEFDERARAMKLLPEGALERINDWSFDRFDDPLLEDGDEIVMAEHLRPRLAEMRETA